MPGVHTDITTLIMGLWADHWSYPAVPVLWRSNDAAPDYNPDATPHFLRNEIDFGVERALAFGGGRRANEIAKFGSVILRVFTARSLDTDAMTLELLSAAEDVFRSRRVQGLSFIGGMSGFDNETGTEEPEENGNWYQKGSLAVFEYRFIG